MRKVVRAFSHIADVAALAHASAIRLLVHCCLTVAVCSAFDRLEAPTHRALFPNVLSSGAPIPKWTGSYLTTWALNTTSADTTDNVSVFDKTGKLTSTKRIWFPDAVTVQILDAAGAGNTVVLVGKALNTNGVYVGFLAFVPVQEARTEVVQLGAFEGVSVAMAEDQTVWVLGYQVGEGRRIKAAPRHSMLRRYTAKGHAAGEFLFWPDKQCGLHPAGETGNGFPMVRAGAGRVGVLLPECREWLELKASGELTSTVALRPVSSNRDQEFIWNVVIASDGRVFGHIGPSLYKLNAKTGSWHEVALSLPGEKPSALVGVDGRALVYVSHGNVAWSLVQ